ncbi:MAG: Lrp/AsnC family transcriptional regulator [Candidatus Nanohaloarchaea archaeon]
MDETDREILRILEENGRKSYTEISEQVGVSEGTVRNRVQDLKDRGVIEKFTVEVREEEEMSAFVAVEIGTESDPSEIYDEISDDFEVFEVAGPLDAFVRVRGENSAEINRAVDRIRAVDGVSSTETYMVLNRR